MLGDLRLGGMTVEILKIQRLNIYSCLIYGVWPSCHTHFCLGAPAVWEELEDQKPPNLRYTWSGFRTGGSAGSRPWVVCGGFWRETLGIIFHSKFSHFQATHQLAHVIYMAILSEKGKFFVLADFLQRLSRGASSAGIGVQLYVPSSCSVSLFWIF